MKRILFAAFLILSIGCKSDEVDVNQSENEKTNWAFNSFEKVDSLNPILIPSSNLSFTCPISKNQVQWEERNVLNPSAVVKGNEVFLFYRAQDLNGTSRIGLAKSSDGLHFEKSPAPVFYPDNDEMKSYEWNYKKLNGDEIKDDCLTCYFDGVEDPRIVESLDGKYIMTYTAYDGKTARLALASSDDLMSWTKHGLVLSEEKYHDQWSKSGAIVVELENGRNIAKKVNGKYWMYFGDTNLFLASSEDLINWEVSINEENKKNDFRAPSKNGLF